MPWISIVISLLISQLIRQATSSLYLEASSSRMLVIWSCVSSRNSLHGYRRLCGAFPFSTVLGWGGTGRELSSIHTNYTCTTLHAQSFVGQTYSFLRLELDPFSCFHGKKRRCSFPLCSTPANLSPHWYGSN